MVALRLARPAQSLKTNMTTVVFAPDKQASQGDEKEDQNAPRGEGRRARRLLFLMDVSGSMRPPVSRKVRDFGAFGLSKYLPGRQKVLKRRLPMQF